MSAASHIRADIAIVGAGSAGLSIAAGAAQLGLKTVLFEADKMGGDCLNHGCVPSKALISVARKVHLARQAARFGATPSPPAINWAAVRDYVHGAIAHIAPNDSVERFERLGVNVITEPAAFAGPDRLLSASTEVTARHIVLATGSVAVIPPLPGLEAVPYLTNRTIFDIDALPEHLLIIGGGPIGTELGQAFARLGSQVTIIVRGRALARAEPAHAAVVLEALRREGVNVLEHCAIGKLERQGDNIALSIKSKDGQSEQITGSHLLVAAGRRPVLERLDLEAGRVEYGSDGIVTGDNLRSVSNRRVWAAGDVAGRGQFTHLAGFHAGVFIRNALFRSRYRADALAVPAVTYTDPEIAQIGIREEEASKRHGQRLRMVEWKFAENDRAITEDAYTGGARILTDHKGRILGASIVGQGAGDIIQLIGVTMSNGLTIRALTNFISPYPTRAELVKRAAGKWYEPILFGAASRRLVGLLNKLP